MRRVYWILAAVAVVCAAVALAVVLRPRTAPNAAQSPPPDVIALPAPQSKSATSVEEALLKRRSVREYKDAPLALAELGQLLWAAQGITDPGGFRTAPSAGALYPLEVYAVVSRVDGLSPGIYKYRPAQHALVRTAETPRLRDLYKAALSQSAVLEAPVVLVFAAVYERTTQKYGERGIRYVHMEAGHAAQNVYLQAVSLGLGTVTIGAFYDDEVQKAVGLEDEEQPLYLMPAGRR